MTKKISKQLFFLLIILAIASFFRFYNLSGINAVPPGLYPDEAMNGNNALEAISTSEYKLFYPENNGREGLYINIQAVFLKIFGNEPWVLRLPGAIVGVLTVLGVYLFGSTLFNNISIGLLSSFFTAISFWHINFSRIGFRAIMAPFFLVWALYLIILAINKNNTINKPLAMNHASWILAAFSGLLFGAGFYTYIAYRGLPLLIFIIFLVYWVKNNRRQDIWEVFKVFGLFTLIALLPMIAYFMQNPQDFFGRTSQISVFNSASPIKDFGVNIIKTIGMFNFSGDHNWRHNFAGNPELYWPVGIMFIFGILYGLWGLIQNLKIKNQNDNLKVKNNISEISSSILHFDFLILISWLIIAAIPVIISNEGIPHALRSILMIPPVFILAGVGAYKLYEISRNKFSGFYKRHDEFIKNSFILLSACLIVQTYNYYFLEWGQNPIVKDAFNQNYVDLGISLNSLPQDIIKYVVVNTGGVDVRGIPMPAQTVMFITDTFTIKKQVEKNIHYILPEEEKDIFENNALFFYLR